MKRLILILIIIFAAVGLTGCTLSFSTGTSKNVGGIFKSYDYGEKWEATNLISKDDKKTKTIDKVNSSLIKIDPQNHSKIYLGTQGDGIFYSENAGGNWVNILSKGNVYDLVLDSKNSGVVYTSLGKNLYKSIDLGENWESIYLEERSKILITSLAIDPVNNLLIYFGTSAGEVYKTLDGGESWQLILEDEEDDAIKKIMVNPKNTRRIYVATATQGIYKSFDKGNGWQNLIDNYITDEKDREMRGMKEFNDMVFDGTQNDSLLFASEYGLLKSYNGGESWQEIKLLTPANSILIRALGINPYNRNQIYYSTENAIYRTFDGGKTWLTSELPSSRIATDLLVDFQTPNVIYMGLGK